MSKKQELTQLTREQIADGKAIARAAHAGDWGAFEGRIESAGGTWIGDIRHREDRQHIIWFNPKRAIQLLELIEYLQLKVETLQLEISLLNDGKNELEFDLLEQELDMERGIE